VRRRYLVGYDISDAKRLRRIHTAMKGWGYPLQYSFFVADLSRSERLMMKQELEEIIHATEDSVIIIDLGEVERFAADRIEMLGAAKEAGSQGSWIV